MSLALPASSCRDTHLPWSVSHAAQIGEYICFVLKMVVFFLVNIFIVEKVGNIVK